MPNVPSILDLLPLVFVLATARSVTYLWFIALCRSLLSLLSLLKTDKVCGNQHKQLRSRKFHALGFRSRFPEKRMIHRLVGLTRNTSIWNSCRFQFYWRMIVGLSWIMVVALTTPVVSLQISTNYLCAFHLTWGDLAIHPYPSTVQLIPWQNQRSWRYRILTSGLNSICYG